MKQVHADMKRSFSLAHAIRILVFPLVHTTLSCKTTLMKRTRAVAHLFLDTA